MKIEFLGGEASVIHNGAQLANFYYCDCCSDFLAVGCDIKGQQRGAVNLNFLHSYCKLGKPILIQPRLLSSNEKLDRWGKLWGVLNGI
jgi:hypothetical protein